jgi:predicted porin
MSSGSVNGTRWGMKGSEDLGGGLKAIFDLQSGFNIDTGGAGQSGLLFGRQAMVGLQSGVGTIKFGRVILPFYDNEGMNDVMMNSSLSAQSNVMRTANNWASSSVPAFEGSKLGGYTLRGDNAFRYDSPNMSGFAASFGYAFNEKTQSVCPQCNGNNGEVVSASLVYAGGPISGVVAFQREKPYQPAGVGVASAGVTDYVGTNSADRNFLRLSGQYDLGMIIAKAGFGRADHVNFIKAAKTNEFQLGLDFKASDVMTLTGGVASSKDDSIGATPEVKRTAFTLGGKYVLSKRTFMYGGYEAGKQEKSGSPDAKESIFAIGVQHRF